MVLCLPATRFTQCARTHTRAFFCTGFYPERVKEVAMLLFHWSNVTHQICEGIMTSPPVPGVCDLLPFKDALAIVLFHLNSTLKSHPSCQPPAVSWLDRPHICHGLKTQLRTSDDASKMPWKTTECDQEVETREVVNNDGQRRVNFIPHCLWHQRRDRRSCAGNVTTHIKTKRHAGLPIINKCDWFTGIWKTECCLITCQVWSPNQQIWNVLGTSWK